MHAMFANSAERRGIPVLVKRILKVGVVERSTESI